MRPQKKPRGAGLDLDIEWKMQDMDAGRVP